MSGTTSPTPRRRLKFERLYHASLKDVWELWTTKEGIESWWGPAGFEVKVRSLDLRPGGEMRYDMIAVGAPQVEFMRRAGMPISTPARVRFTEVVPRQRLVYVHIADFIPGMNPYDVEHVVELHRPAQGQVRMVLTVEAMHDEEWTQRAVAGWHSELDKLGALISARSTLP